MKSQFVVIAFLLVPLLAAAERERDVKYPVAVRLKDGRTQSLKLDWIDDNKVVGFTHGDLRPVTNVRNQVASISFDGDQSDKFTRGQEGLITRKGYIVIGHVTMTGANTISVKPQEGRSQEFAESEVAFINLGEVEHKGQHPAEGLMAVVPATEQWTDTRIDVRKGQRIWFTVSPRDLVSCSPQLQDVNADGADPFFSDSRRPLPDIKACALIAKTGGQGKPFRVGLNSTPFTADEDGRIYLGLNDYDFRDNSGRLTVYIRLGEGQSK
jgi:hypothetical protein